MSLEKEAAFDSIAAERGISTSEFLRQAGDRAANDDLTDEAELAALVDELVETVPAMQRRLKRSATLLRESAREIDTMMREAAIRK